MKNQDRNYNTDEEYINRKNIKRKKVTKGQKVWLVIWIVLFFLVTFQVIKLLGYTIGKVDKNKMYMYNGINKVVKLLIDTSTKNTEEFSSVKIASLGDVYITANMLRGAKTTNGYNFSAGTQEVKDTLKNFDFVLASLNTPVVEKTLGYTKGTIYASPIELLNTLKELNVSTVATATSHAADKGEKGVSQTIENLKSNQINQIGVNDDSKNRAKPIILEKNNIKIGVISYTTSLNVKLSNKNSYLVNIYDEKIAKENIEYLNNNNVDFIIAYIDIGNEDSLITNGEQKLVVEELFDLGVNVVFGTGSSVVQGYVEDQITVGENINHIYSIYSLGDFFGKYKTTDNQLSLIGDIEFTKNITKNKKGEIIKSKKDFNVKKPIALWTEVDNTFKKQIYLLDNEINLFNEDKSDFTNKEILKLKEAQTRISTIFK